MAYTFGPLSSPDGVRDVAFDLTDILESGEVVNGTPTVVASDTSLLTIASVAISTTVLTNDLGDSVAIGKAVQWRMTSLVAIETVTSVVLEITGDGGTVERFRLVVPMVTDVV